jgi:hypothetical protein
VNSLAPEAAAKSFQDLKELQEKRIDKRCLRESPPILAVR